MAAEDGAGNASGKRGATSRELEVARVAPPAWCRTSGPSTVRWAAPVPRYSGSDESVAVPVFGFGVRSPYGIFLNTDHGLGWETNTMGSTFRIYVGPSASRKDHRRAWKARTLRGMGDIKSRAQVGFDAETDVGPVTLSASVQHAFKKGDDRDTGSATLFNLGASAKVYDGPAGKIGLSLNSTFGDGNYMRTWYGVSGRQSAKSGYRKYEAEGRPGEHLAGRGVVVSAEQVLDADGRRRGAPPVRRRQDSPIVKERNQYSVGTMVTHVLMEEGGRIRPRMKRRRVRARSCFGEVRDQRPWTRRPVSVSNQCSG